jgi:hypothetical protein
MKINVKNFGLDSFESELKSEFFFLTGCLVLKYEDYLSKTKQKSSSDFEQEDVNEFEAIFISSSSNQTKFSNEKFIAFFCFSKSSQLSKPNSDSSTAKPTSDIDLVNTDLSKLIQRNSCWKYSICGNWIRFIIQKSFSNQQQEFLKQVRDFTETFEVRRGFMSKIKTMIQTRNQIFI